jgi:hypothetical protein
MKELPHSTKQNPKMKWERGNYCTMNNYYCLQKILAMVFFELGASIWRTKRYKIQSN